MTRGCILVVVFRIDIPSSSSTQEGLQTMRRGASRVLNRPPIGLDSSAWPQLRPTSWGCYSRIIFRTQGCRLCHDKIDTMPNNWILIHSSGCFVPSHPSNLEQNKTEAEYSCASSCRQSSIFRPIVFCRSVQNSKPWTSQPNFLSGHSCPEWSWTPNLCVEWICPTCVSN